ncbi:MAG: extracellular solute-binding protein [Christensenellaceae bacterium]|jgi:raffinose/stachyose/melibiose transport system substrate-binding protein|nr:extracellular solute-binding protein [Christensenellaceae bacterium]
MRLRKTFTIALAIFLLLSLAACGTPASPATEAPAQGGSATAAPANPAPAGETKKVELLTWTNEPTVLFLQSIQAGFTEAYPGFELVISNVPSGDHDSARETRVAANNVDIISFQTFALPQEDWNKNFVDKPTWQQYIDDGLLLDLTDEAFMKNYSADILAGNAYKDRFYSICQGTVAYTGVFYNKAIFAELGLSEPKTWDEFIAICEAVKAGGKYSVITAGAADNWPLNMFKNAIFNAMFTEEESAKIGRKLLTGELKHTDPSLAGIYACMEQFASYMEPGVAGINYSDAPGRFAAGNMAMYADGSWTAPTIETANPELDFGYFSLPGLAARDDGLQPQFGIKYDLSFSVPSNAPNKEGALHFLEFFSRKEIYTSFLNSVGGFSPTQADTTLENAFLNSLAPGLQKPKLNPEFLIYGLKGVGEYGANGGFSFFYLDVLGGPYTKEQLAQAAADDYATALASLSTLQGQ